MTDEQDYLLFRREKKITLIEIANEINCSPSLLSKFETGNCNMDSIKIKKYKDYIKNK